MLIKVYRLHRDAVALQANMPGSGLPAAQTRSWEMLCPHAVELTWNGGPRAEDVAIRIEGQSAETPPFVQSQLGHGVISFYPSYQIKTEAPYGLWLGGSTDRPKDGITPLETLLDAAALPCTVVVHWQLTRANHTVRFEAGEPFARLLLHATRYPGGVPLDDKLEIVEHTDDSNPDPAFMRLATSYALENVFQRLAGDSVPSPKQDPKEPLPPGCFDTIDGRIDLNQFEPGFFRPEKFLDRPREHYLRRNGEIYRRDFFVIDERKLVFLSVPKVACTAIKLALAKVRGIEFGPDDDVEYLIHFHPKWHREQGTLRPAQDGYYRFAFVRNPFDRLVSCYRGKIMFQESAKQRVPLYHDYFFHLPINISFEDFVARVCKIPDALADSHFKSQYSMLYSNDVLQVDTVGRFEQLDADWRPIAERFGLTPVLGVANPSKDKQGAHSDYRLYYTEQLVQQVYERYRNDVHTFGYEEEYRQLLAFVREHAKEPKSS